MKSKSKLAAPQPADPQSAIRNPQSAIEAIRNPQSEASHSLGIIFDRAARAVLKKEPQHPIEARFYPYAGASATIRLRGERVIARISDVLAESPPEVLFALACILVAKLYRRKTPPEQQCVYREYIARPAVRAASDAARRNRGYKITSSPQGRVYDLEALFGELNARYFEGRLPAPQLSWSQRPTRHVLGHHDHIHDTIVISRTLDSARVPRFIVEYVLYHEMLHAKHPPRAAGSRTVYHSPQFRADEHRFERFDEALKWLEEVNWTPRRRKTVKRRR